MYIYEKKADGFFSICLNMYNISFYDGSTLLANGKQRFYIYEFELLKIAL